MKDDIVIVGAARTPVGAFNGAFGSLPAHELGKTAIQAALTRAGVEGARISEVIMGQILTAAQGQNPARQASIAAGIPVESPAWGINMLCGSGLRAVALGAQQIALGSSSIVVAGGQESMSMAPHCAHLRDGTKMGDMKFIDTMIKDGLWDAFNGYHMGNTAENVARQWQITREEQDRFAVASQNKAEAAKKAGKFKDEIVPVVIKTRKGETVPEHPVLGHSRTGDCIGPTWWRGDRLWVKESGVRSLLAGTGESLGLFRHDVPETPEIGRYWVERIRAPGASYNVAGYTRASALLSHGAKVCPSIHMPRWASRILLEVTDVSVQRLHDISEKDALAEGVERNPRHGGVATDWLPLTAREGYRELWESINGPGSWDRNEWVWCMSFTRIKP